MDEYEELNRDFVEKSEPVIKMILIALIPIGVLLDIIIWRRRQFANWLLYYELVSILLQGFVPFNFGDFQLIMLLMLMIQTFITVACDLSPNVICCTIVCLIMMFGQFPIMYNEIWSISMVVGKILNALFLFIILTILSMLVTYIAQIRSKVNRLIVENLNLLDRMHEGVIVLSEADMKLTFASKPAFQLLKAEESVNLRPRKPEDVNNLMSGTSLD